MTLDYPPIWTILCMALAWGIALVHAPWGSAWLFSGGSLILVGVMLAVWAALAFKLAKTTIIPHQPPSALVSTGPFQFSRNPIYLADLIILAGWCICLGAPLALLLVPALWWVLRSRFILPEEARLTEHLGQPYLDYKARVRRWI